MQGTQCKPAISAKGKFMTLVKSIMSKDLKTIKAGASLQEAYDLMQEFRIRHLPVLNTQGDISGVLTYKDVVADKAVLKLPVEYFMSYPVEQVAENASLKHAALTMLEKKLTAVLITNEEQEVVGIVTTDDLLWHLASHLQNESDEASPLLSRLGLQTTVGEIANMLSQAGI